MMSVTHAYGQSTGMSTNALQATFEKAGAQITCLECQAMLRARIREVCQQWFAVKVRISVVEPRGEGWLMGAPLSTEDDLSGRTR